ncbi:VOC family protein [Halobacillus sp. A5]|uniref:VOC family protein n=1 Tax=Halobacillus sp. A5 TaxID=2880263 RepID=UPI0020A69D99|nr:VOC family protein [Halobacillus sp. A5]MCP3027079.1 VOC family protein [Halobacillus sp. A5]
MIERIDTVCMIVSDVEKSEHFYEEVLDFKVVFKGEGYRVLQVGEGGTPLTIEEGQVRPEANQTYPIFFSRQITQLYEKLQMQSVRVSDLHNDGVNHYFNFYDPDGNQLQVCYFE